MPHTAPHRHPLTPLLSLPPPPPAPHFHTQTPHTALVSQGQFPFGPTPRCVCPKSPKVAYFLGIFILPQLVFQDVSIARTLPWAWLFDNLAVHKAVRKKLRGTRLAWRRGLASEAPGSAGDHLESCPRRFHFPDGPRDSVSTNGNLAAGEFVWTSGIAMSAQRKLPLTLPPAPHFHTTQTSKTKTISA
eukprot:351219-Chlamydomonas_euryale.AAC.4